MGRHGRKRAVDQLDLLVAKPAALNSSPGTAHELAPIVGANLNPTLYLVSGHDLSPNAVGPIDVDSPIPMVGAKEEPVCPARVQIQMQLRSPIGSAWGRHGSLLRTAVHHGPIASVFSFAPFGTLIRTNVRFPLLESGMDSWMVTALS